MTIENKAFTLIEIVVAITILAILSVLWLLTLQIHQKDARDSVRITDIENIIITMDTYYIQSKQFPEPSDYVDITYTWSMIWQQGTIWESVTKNLKILNKQFYDPLLKTPYTYSRLNTKEQFQIATILEGSLVQNTNPLSKTYAANSVWVDDWIAYIKWKYNWLISSVKIWSEVLAIATPSIITSDISNTTYEDIITKNRLLYDWEWFNGQVTWINFKPFTLLAYKWNWRELDDIKKQVQVMRNIKDIYCSWRFSERDIITTKLLKSVINPNAPSPEYKRFSNKFL